MLVNYMDRGNLSVAAPDLMKELQMPKSQMGLLLSSFFWTYAAFQLLSGWLVDRFNVSRVYAVGYLVWSVATLCTGFIGGFASLFALRLALGIAESVAYPAYSRILSENFDDARRGIANGLIDVGTKFGTAAGTLLGGWLISGFGWRFFFISTGAVSLLWLIPWLRYAPTQAPPAAKQEDTTAVTGWSEILSKRAAWATFFGLFCFNYAWYFLLTWLPTYLRDERHFSTQMMAAYSAFPLVVTAISTIVTGTLSDRWIARGADAGKVRRRLVMLGLTVIACSLPLSTVPSHELAMSMLFVAFAGLGIYTANCWALTQRLAGVTAVGKWTGAQNAIGNLGGVVAPAITGLLVDRLGSFQYAFFTASAVALCGAFIYGWMLHRPTPVEWSAPPAVQQV